MPGLFVTATGTEVGKTYVSAGLIRAARRAGYPVGALKPVVSGFDPDHLAGSDPAVLLGALGVAANADAVATMAPWRFKAPLSPDMAAALEGRSLPFDAVLAACRDAITPDRLTLIEGVGGVMVPLGGGRTILDLMAGLTLPIVLVSPTGLGALSHLLTALEALKARGLRPAAVVLNEIAATTVPLDRTIATLGPFWPSADLFVLAAGTAATHHLVFDGVLAHVARAVGTDRFDRRD